MCSSSAVQCLSHGLKIQIMSLRASAASQQALLLSPGLPWSPGPVTDSLVNSMIAFRPTFKKITWFLAAFSREGRHESPGPQLLSPVSSPDQLLSQQRSSTQASVPGP